MSKTSEPTLPATRLSREPRPIGKITILGGVVIAGIVAWFYGPMMYHVVRYRPYSIPSAAMEPTIDKGDRIYVDERYYRTHSIKDGDLIVFQHHDNILVKRVCALGGETIAAKDGVLYRNGVALNEPYVKHSKPERDEVENFETRTVPVGQVFVTGDSRDQSLDSRSEEYGPVYVSDVRGKVKSVYLSSTPGQMGRVF